MEQEEAPQDMLDEVDVFVVYDSAPAESQTFASFACSRELDDLNERVAHILKVAVREIEDTHSTFRSNFVRWFQGNGSHASPHCSTVAQGESAVQYRSTERSPPNPSPGQESQWLHSDIRSDSRDSREMSYTSSSKQSLRARTRLQGESEAVQTATFEPTVTTDLPRSALANTMGAADTRPLRRVDFKLFAEWIGPIDEEDDNDDEKFGDQLQYYANLQSLHGRKLVEFYHSMSDAAPSMPALSSHCCVTHPSSAFRTFWDMCACALLAYDFYVIPLGIFNIPSDGFFMYMHAIVMFYWSADILQTFFAGYFRDGGGVEMRMWPIAKRYLKGWFLPDIIIVSADWLSFLDGPISGDSAGFLRLGKVSRLARVMRVLRLVRARRLLGVMEKVNNAIGMESTAIVLSIAKNIVFISLMNHVLAALWFWVGLLNEEEGWLKYRKSDHWFDNYILALSWSTANFTPGSSDIRPNTTPEYTFHVLSLFLALVIFSVFVSTTTSLITKLMNIRSAQTHKIWMLKGFLQQQKFPSEFRDRVLRYVHTAIGARKDMIPREDVELLGVLSKPLREEVQSFCQLLTLRVHPLMRLLAGTNPAMMRTLCTEAVSEIRYSRGDAVFTYGERMHKMSFVVAGVLSYAVIHDPHIRGDAGREFIGPLDYFCEAALWTKWHCRGTLIADADCEVLDVDGPIFRKSVTSHHIMTGLVRQYAQAFIDDLKSTVQTDTDMSQSPATRFRIKISTTDLQQSLVHEGDALQSVLSLFQHWPRLPQSSSSGLIMNMGSLGSGKSAIRSPMRLAA